MVTGDHPVTARAIARSVNIMPGETIDEVAKRTGQVRAAAACRMLLALTLLLLLLSVVALRGLRRWARAA